MENFNPVLRFVAVSDVHYKSERTKETERMEKAMKAAYRIAEEHPTYKKLDALVVVGDFANSGEQVQMDLFKETLDNFTKEETKKIMLISSHEFHGTGGMEGGYERFEKTFSQKGDQHNVINGFHFEHAKNSLHKSMDKILQEKHFDINCSVLVYQVNGSSLSNTQYFNPLCNKT